MKYVLVFIAIVIGLFMAKKQWRAAQDRQRKDDLPHQPEAAKDAVDHAPQSMVACAYCGVYLAQSQAVVQGGKSYCCTEHMQAHQSADQPAKPGGTT